MTGFVSDPARPLAMLAKCPAHGTTPLHRLVREGLPDLMVKDESARMGLGAFKALGGAYAVAAILAERLEAEGLPAAPDALMGEDARRVAAGLTFVCASAGNHGMSVAAGARVFGARARILLAETVPEAFADRLRAKGAEVVRAGRTYEESVAAAIRDAAGTGAIHLADGAWPGYTAEPALVMEGYTVIAEELRATFDASGDWPDRVYLPGGVGGLAAAMAVSIRRSWEGQPRILVVEPDAAPCLAASARSGTMATVEGPVSEMGRLDCKTASLLAVEGLRPLADIGYLAVSDAAAEAAAAMLGDAGHPTTPSGAAATAGLLAEEAEGDGPARPLVLMTEGPL